MKRHVSCKRHGKRRWHSEHMAAHCTATGGIVTTCHLGSAACARTRFGWFTGPGTLARRAINEAVATT